METTRERAPAPAEIATRVERAVAQVIRGKQEITRLLLTALIARGHVLIEDIPGVGKTTIARALAACLGGRFQRIQFTSDLLPSDILGISVYDQSAGRFEFKPGPIFANIVLADEINRTTPRTQSSLLEALNEGQVTVDAQTHTLDAPFMVVATQNPVEHFGTYPLPESQLDRFLLCLEIGYPEGEDERKVIAERRGDDPVVAIEPVVSVSQIVALQQQVDAIYADPSLLDYVMAVVESTRQSNHLALGVSTRGAIAWYRAAKAFAMLAGRDYCSPDDLKQLAMPVLAHRVLLSGPAAQLGGVGALDGGRADAEQILAEILERVPVPL
ncbi:MAG: ATPase [Proteobacteria bacterium]|nr:MAG: ATPase [Pseudomonadota bacterium]PIE18251.1 MAG: ATPase [Pseudomonadota bacterium]